VGLKEAILIALGIGTAGGAAVGVDRAINPPAVVRLAEENKAATNPPETDARDHRTLIRRSYTRIDDYLRQIKQQEKTPNENTKTTRDALLDAAEHELSYAFKLHAARQTMATRPGKDLDDAVKACEEEHRQRYQQAQKLVKAVNQVQNGTPGGLERFT